MYKMKNTKTLNSIENSIVEKIKVGLQYGLNRDGICCLAPSEMCFFTNLKNGSIDNPVI
jgi:choline dehydrogenase